MGIQNWSEDVILVDLQAEPELGGELKCVTEMVRDRAGCDVVVDFCQVDIVASSSLSKLLKLRKCLADSRRGLVLCGLAPATAGIFTVTGLDGLFEIADNRFLAMAGLQTVG